MDDDLMTEDWYAQELIVREYYENFDKPKQETTVNTTNFDEMTFDQLVPKNSKYLSKEDVGEDGVILTIKGFRMETLKNDDGDDDRMVLYFVEDFKPMVLNRTNSQLIGVVTGVSTAGAAKGKQIVVYNDPTVGFGGKITGGLRIKKVGGLPVQAPRRADDTGDIPF